MSPQRPIRRLALVALGLAFVSSCTLLFDPSERDQSGADGGVGDDDGGMIRTDGGVTDRRSCANLAPTCGMEGTLDCCQTLFSNSVTFPMGRSTAGSDSFATADDNELPEHDATPSGFFLDRFEITVGRFRAFLDDYQRPTEGDGAHPAVAGSGWTAEFSVELADDPEVIEAQLECHPDFTWTTDPSNNENKPINCATWYELYAFCIWDGGRLPTEAEWELVAAAGLNNRLYPWGTEPASGRAAFDSLAPPFVVGSFPSGDANSGHRDLAGNVWEWTRDRFSDAWYGGAGDPCNDCINLNMPTTMGFAIRGGGYNDAADHLRAARRDTATPETRRRNIGARCARDLP